MGRSIHIGKEDYQIVGLVEAEGTSTFMKRSSPTSSFPSPRMFSFECVLFVETAGEPRALVSHNSERDVGVDKHLPIVNAVTFREYMRRSGQGNVRWPGCSRA